MNLKLPLAPNSITERHIQKNQIVAYDLIRHIINNHLLRCLVFLGYRIVSCVGNIANMRGIKSQTFFLFLKEKHHALQVRL